MCFLIFELYCNRYKTILLAKFSTQIWYGKWESESFSANYLFLFNFNTFNFHYIKCKQWANFSFWHCYVDIIPNSTIFYYSTWTSNKRTYFLWYNKLCLEKLQLKVSEKKQQCNLVCIDCCCHLCKKAIFAFSFTTITTKRASKSLCKRMNLWFSLIPKTSKPNRGLITLWKNYGKKKWFYNYQFNFTIFIQANWN